MTPVELSRTVLHAVRRAVDGGELSVSVPERAVVTSPGPGGCGDYATNIALQLSRAAGQPPLHVAEILRARLAEAPGVTDVVVTGPGFLNLRLRRDAPGELVQDILRAGPRYGHAQPHRAGTRSAPVHLHCPAELRALVVADALARILRSQGADVRISCAGELEGGSADALGLRIDAHGTGAHGSTGNSLPDAPPPETIRPVPAPPHPDPLTLLGPDATRWALLHPAAHDRPRLTPEHLVQREGNPLFRVRYAHARTRALLRNAADLGFAPDAGAGVPPSPVQALLADHPRVLSQAASHRAPDRLARHLVSVADAVLPLLPAVLPIGEEKPSAAHRARLALAAAAGAVLAGGLSLLGIHAPDHL
ncbi:ArgS-related anticodon-binding protein NrtL [Streptomyces sp. NPDC006610]|uniref:ArgS-related anticodon-binding protein NrtL n=1 Tax=Streptomyces sp. NPDC006610 TaxID=3154584 RepID=UPI0033A3EEED